MDPTEQVPQWDQNFETNELISDFIIYPPGDIEWPPDSPSACTAMNGMMHALLNQYVTMNGPLVSDIPGPSTSGQLSMFIPSVFAPPPPP